MADHAISENPAVQVQLDRLARLSPGIDILGLDRITQLLEKIGNPHLRLPPVFHVAGTNGKGSTCAFLRAGLEADGRSVHVYTSPHLLRFNERIRLNGKLIEDDLLAATLKRVLDAVGKIEASFFEVTTAAAFLLFAEHPADACIIEVGLGGRLDATNIIPAPATCGIASLGIDHAAFLLIPERDTPTDPMCRIAFEKAGIAKRGVPLVTMRYQPPVAATIARQAAMAGARWQPMGNLWDAAVYREHLHYRDVKGRLELPLPRLVGQHQAMNAALAVAMLRHQTAIPVSETALKALPLWAQWPARLQPLDENGPLMQRLNGEHPRRPVWLDGGHNADAGAVLGYHFDQQHLRGQKLRIVIGMLANKDLKGFLAPLHHAVGHIHCVPVPGHDAHEPREYRKLAQDWKIGCTTHDSIMEAVNAIAALPSSEPVLFCGTLYNAGEILRLNNQIPD
jgi:dihydrofolate synthase/folylpolyglutamate synthase